MAARAVPPSSPGNGLKRDPALVPLSRDHHEALVQARALRIAASGGEAERGKHPVLATARGFLGYFEQQLLGHMQDEERTLLPVAEAAGVDSQRIRSEHQELRGLAAGIGESLRAASDPAALMQEAGQLLDDHVRYEERAFFEAVQQALTAQQLHDLGRALEAAREARGGPSCAVNLSAGRPDPSPTR